MAPLPREGTSRIGRAVQTASALVADERRARWRIRPIDERVVLYESFNGNGAVCNPEAIFRALVVHPDFSDLQHVWSLAGTVGPTANDPGQDAFRAEFASNPRVRFVEPLSDDYERTLVTARYLVTNATFGRQFSKRPGQTLVNTWHGTPLKKMGFDIGSRPSRVSNVLRNFLQADYLVSGNAFTTDVLYDRSHRLDGLFEGVVLETGAPRVDRQFVDAAGLTAIREMLEQRGLAIGDSRVVLWAPTWRGNNSVKPSDDADALLAQRSELAERLTALVGDDVTVLLKPHQSVHERAAALGTARESLVPNDVPANVVLAVADVLLTDYSSIFFDYLSLVRPIVHFAPDLDDYRGYRGLYLEPSEWPGPITATIADTAERLRDALAPDTPLPRAHEALTRRMATHDDGRATDRVIAAVFGAAATGAAAEGGAASDAAAKSAARSDAPTKPSRKRRVVLALPSSASATRLAAALDLVAALDYDALDVTVLLTDSRRSSYLAAQRLLDPRARLLVRQGVLDGPPSALAQRQIAERFHALRAHRRLPAVRRLWDDEWARVSGGAHFDAAVDLVATQPFWLTLLQHTGAATTAVWAPTAADTAIPSRRLSDALALHSQFAQRIDADQSATAAAATLRKLLDA